MTYAKIIEDSVWMDTRHTGDECRLTTMEVQFHRWVLTEFNTHRKFSRNSASSRAIPFAKQVAKVLDAPALPVVWATEQKGMQGGEALDAGTTEEAEALWLEASQKASEVAQDLHYLGVHKSIVNRLLEPFLMHTVVVTSTGWENFFTQRCSPLAQPEIRVAAELMQKALAESEPKQLTEHQWHLPYVEETEWMTDEADWRAVSAARCARVSYLTQDGKRDIREDVDLYHRLTKAEPPHWSPLEHVATPDTLGVGHGNLDGWMSLRSLVENEMGLDTNL